MNFYVTLLGAPSLGPRSGPRLKTPPRDPSPRGDKKGMSLFATVRLSFFATPKRGSRPVVFYDRLGDIVGDAFGDATWRGVSARGAQQAANLSGGAYRNCG